LVSLLSINDDIAVGMNPNSYFNNLNSVSLYKEMEPGNTCEMMQAPLKFRGNLFGSRFTNLFYCQKEGENELKMNLIHDHRASIMTVDPTKNGLKEASFMCKFNLEYDFGEIKDSIEYNVVYSRSDKIPEPTIKKVNKKLTFKKSAIELNDYFEYDEHMIEMQVIPTTSQSSKLTSNINFPKIDSVFYSEPDTSDFN
jgi:hypothetical protein